MFFRILKLDLKKKKVMNILLLLFIILASIFSASGLNNIVTVMNGTDYYFDKAEIGDFAIITTSSDEIFGVLDKEKAVKSYKYDTCIIGSKNNIKIKGEKVDTNFNIIFQSLEKSSMKFFDKNDNVLTNINKGEVYITGDFLEDNKLSTGDYITVDLENQKIDLKIAGVAKDAFLGSKFMGNKRFLLNDKDYQDIYDYFYKEEVKGENVTALGNKIIYVETDNPNEISKAISEVTSVMFNGPRDTLKLCYVMDMIVAFVVLILSVCLVIVALLILKFTITFTINEEYREIGVMKAIGINSKNIRNLYIIKYLTLAIVGSIIGGFLSVPFGNMMIESTTKNMVLGNTTGVGLNIIGAVFIVVVTVLFAYLYTKKVKKASPVDAIRNGQTGERYKTKTVYKMKNSHIRLNLYMAINDILSAPRRFITIIISLFVCLIFVLGVVVTTDTMKSKNLQSTFGTECDAYFNPTDAMDMFKYSSKDEFKKGMIDKYEKIFEENGMAARVSIDLLYNYKVLFNGDNYNIKCMQGVNTKADEYLYKEGIAPIKENEIAITDKVADMMGAKIGDKITIDFGEGKEKQELIVTAIFQSLNNIGQVIRLKENLYNTEEKKKEVIEGILKNTDEIEHYVNEIVKNSREDFLDLPVDNKGFYLNEVMEKIEKYYKDKLETIHTTFFVGKYTNCILKGDKDRIIEVIQNVIENAIKYGDGKEIKIGFSEEEDFKLVTILNTGCELKEQDLPHIFDSFYRGSNSKKQEGSGLGLYICKQLMHKMDGDIFAQIYENNVFEVTVVIRKA